MITPQSIEIVGGGLAGLSLGLALQRSGVPTTIYEAGAYPRHRVCGEFIAGLKDRTIETMGLHEILADAQRHRTVRWFRHDRQVREQTLNLPALAISRHTLDARIAKAFQKAEGKLVTRTRIETAATQPGRVFATGRRRAASEWLGLKAHVRSLKLSSDLEFHLGNEAYVGLCAVENGAVNVCGLFRQRSGLAVTRSSALLRYLGEAGLHSLVERINSGKVDESSFSAVAGINFDRPKGPLDRVYLGDAYAMIPPYTGNGMAMAFQSAECALTPLLAWARRQCDWDEVIRVTATALRRRFNRRLILASQLHPFLLSPGRQSLFDVANRAGLLPLRALATVVHA